MITACVIVMLVCGLGLAGFMVYMGIDIATRKETGIVVTASAMSLVQLGVELFIACLNGIVEAISSANS